MSFDSCADRPQDLDWYSESRSLVYSGPVARRSKSEMDWHPWSDLFVALLDNYREFCVYLSLALQN
jgi:hypothetical protein